jgi:hypothetical protein
MQGNVDHNCLFGIFKKHGQQVFEINPDNGSERLLLGTI